LLEPAYHTPHPLVISKLVTLLKITDAPIDVSGVLVLLVTSSLNVPFKYPLFCSSNVY